jgi:hypothetical protein
MKVVLCGIIILPAILGCANTKYAAATSAKANGIRYYRPATYILIKPDYEKRQASVGIFHVPDTRQVFVADPWSWMASNNTTMEFSKGLLSKASSNVNTAEVPSALAKATADVLKEAIAAAAAAASKGGAVAARVRDERPERGIFLFFLGENGPVQIFPR